MYFSKCLHNKCMHNKRSINIFTTWKKNINKSLFITFNMKTRGISNFSGSKEWVVAPLTLQESNAYRLLWASQQNRPLSNKGHLNS
jgi:hypothetical protein